MRRLIRLFLFTVARLGLFLAVAACVHGQIYLSRISVRTGGGDFRCSTSEIGLQMLWLNFDGFSKRAAAESWASTGFFSEAASPEAIEEEESKFAKALIPCLITITDSLKVAYIGLRHWITISLAVAFYACLKFIYRKRSSPRAEDAACEG